MSKYTKLINVICFDHVTRFLCSDWLKCRITHQCDMALVITLSVLVLHIQNQPRREYEVGYQREYQAVYQPECRARRAARRLIHGLIQAWITHRVFHSRLVLYLLYLQAFKFI